MSASYIVGSTSAKLGDFLPHPDQPLGSGVSLPMSINSTYTTMAQVHGSMTNMAWREVLAETVCTVVPPRTAVFVVIPERWFIFNDEKWIFPTTNNLLLISSNLVDCSAINAISYLTFNPLVGEGWVPSEEEG